MKNIITLLLLLASLFCFAQNAALDPNFGNSGVSVHPHPHTAEINCFAFDSNGNIISAGYSRQGGAGTYNYQLTLTKTDSNGILDTNFGTNGKVTTIIEYSDSPLDIVVQPDDKIIVVGSAYLGPTPTGPGPYIAFATRYNIDGSLDTSFATNGVYRLTSVKQFVSVMLLPDNSIVLGGNSYLNNELFGILVKLDSNGVADNQFGTNGILSLYSNNFQFLMWSSFLLSDGNIFCFGYDKSLGISNSQSAYCKIDTQGNFDSSFGINGKVVIDFYNTTSNITELLNIAQELPNGQIIMGGYEAVAFLTKINADGTLDTLFGANGVVNHSFSSNSMALQPDGKIIIGGNKGVGNGNIGYTVTRFDSNGSLDTSFNNGSGFVDIDISSSNDYLQHIKLQSADTLIIGGSSYLNSAVANFTLARVLLDTPLSIEEPLEQFVKIYPNPFEERFFIEDYEQVIEEIKIFDNTGRLIKVISNPNPIQEIYTDFSSGVYHINIKAKDGRIMNRKVIRK
ncbi:MAG: T9SS type A sorting domain-containing protein [Weeksellaceae bacterium]|nr:T9SS type A sorting domain-containing protein [Weeksellaceae bacterium]